MTTSDAAGAHAFVFPGQGSQYVGMGAELAGTSPGAATIFERADKALGFALSRLMFEGPADELDSTINAQPAILAASIAALEHLRERAKVAGLVLNPLAVAGHSAGQYAAAIAAGAVEFDEALRLVRERGRIMQERGIDGGMGAIIGLSEEQAEQVVEQAREHGEISVANINAPGQVVLSGVLPALVFALEMSKTVGARRAVQLTVSVASHSPLMRHARDEFAKVLERAPFRDPVVPVVGNVHATMIRSADGLREELTEHLVHGVQWVATVRNMAAIGVTDFVEVGPGRVLTGLIKRISPESNAHALDDAEDGWLPAGASATARASTDTPSTETSPKRTRKKA